MDQVAAIEPEVKSLAVQVTEIRDGIAANRQTLEAVTGTDFDAAIDLSVKKAFDDRLDGALEELIERKYVTTAPTTGSDGFDQQITSNAAPFLTKQEGDDATARAVARALKKGGKG